MINSEDWIAPRDYKVFCFNGCPKYIMTCDGREKDGPHKFYFFDAKWELVNLNATTRDAPSGFSLEKPKCLDNLLNYAGKLSKPFPFVRVDFYIVNEKVYFGELTFTPCAGLDTNILPEADAMMGKELKI